MGNKAGCCRHEPHEAAQPEVLAEDPQKVDEQKPKACRVCTTVSLTDCGGDSSTAQQEEVISKNGELQTDHGKNIDELPLPKDVEINGCGFSLDAQVSNLDKNDPVLDYYKKDGLFGAVTGAFGDKKTMYCHHLKGQSFAVRAAEGQKFGSTADVWRFIEGQRCCGRMAYDRSAGKLVCGPCFPKDHDKTCNPETCLFVANGLPCPTPDWALK